MPGQDFTLLLCDQCKVWHCFISHSHKELASYVKVMIKKNKPANYCLYSSSIKDRQCKYRSLRHLTFNYKICQNQIFQYRSAPLSIRKYLYSTGSLFSFQPRNTEQTFYKNQILISFAKSGLFNVFVLKDRNLIQDVKICSFFPFSLLQWTCTHGKHIIRIFVTILISLSQEDYDIVQ